MELVEEAFGGAQNDHWSDAMESYNVDNHNSQIYSEEPRNAGITSRSTVSLFVRLFANFHLHKIKLRVLLITIYPTYP